MKAPKFEVKLPKGWRWVKNGEIIKENDLWAYNNEWHNTWYSPDEKLAKMSLELEPHIRRIPKRAKP